LGVNQQLLNKAPLAANYCTITFYKYGQLPALPPKKLYCKLLIFTAAPLQLTESVELGDLVLAIADDGIVLLF